MGTPQLRSRFKAFRDLTIIQKAQDRGAVLTENILPMLNADGGSMEVVDMKDSGAFTDVFIRYKGACATCASRQDRNIRNDRFHAEKSGGTSPSGCTTVRESSKNLRAVMNMFGSGKSALDLKKITKELCRPNHIRRSSWAHGPPTCTCPPG
jgi:hypothetical protein